jgi:hypothetical protein
MASYFELPPQQSTGAANIDAVPEEQKQQLGRTSLLSPAVTQLLDNWGADNSDSDSEEGSLSEKEDTSLDDPTKKNNPGKSQLDSGPERQKPATSLLSPKTAERSPARESVPVKSPPARPGASGSTKKTGQPHMARFHSLRSMLFFSNMEDKVKKMSHEDREKEAQAANKWKRQHDQRQIPGRLKSPENDPESKEHGIGSRIKTRMKRMASKDVPTMTTLNEDGGAHDFSDHDSTASSDVEKEPYKWKPRESDEESINHSDVEDLVRWVSRRDPPSDGEARTASKAPQITVTKDDSDRESIGNSDVDDLVQWVSRKSSGPETEQEDLKCLNDASTESDSDRANDQDSSDEEDADDLVRWISRRDGSTAGPVRRKQQDDTNSGKFSSHVKEDSEISELGHWVKRNRTTSGGTANTSPTLSVPEEPERGRPLSRDGPARPQPKGHITNEDVNELVNWISRKESKDQNPLVDEQEVKELQREEDAKKKQLGMTLDEGSLSHSDVKGLIEEVKSSDLALQGFVPTVKASSAAAETHLPARPNEAESGDFRQHRTIMPEGCKAKASDYLTTSRSASTDVEVGKGKQKSQRDSLGEEDVDELVKWISRKS